MKKIYYKVMTEVNHGTEEEPNIVQIFNTAEILCSDNDFEKCMGKRVEVKLYAPMKGKKLFEATLVGYDEHCVEIEEKGEKLKLEKTKIAKICRAIDFDALLK